MKLDTLMRTFITLGPIGFLPASGTIATLCALIPVILLSQASGIVYMVVLVLLTLCSYMMINAQLSFFKESDPREIVIDEVIGCLAAFAGCVLTPYTVLGGFCLFRLLDIYKPLGIFYIQRLPGAWGILLDDILAGIVTALCLHYVGKIW